MKNLNYLLFSSFVLFAFSCKSTYQLKATGDQAQLNFHNETEMVVELLSYQDNELYFQVGEQYYKTPLRDIERIKIIEPYPASGKSGIMAGLGIANTALGFSMTKDDWGTGTMKVTAFVLAALAFANASPAYKFRPPLNPQKAKRLKLFCRYQYGLLPEQMEALLKHAGQKEFSLLNSGH